MMKAVDIPAFKDIDKINDIKSLPLSVVIKLGDKELRDLMTREVELYSEIQTVQELIQTTIKKKNELLYQHVGIANGFNVSEHVCQCKICGRRVGEKSNDVQI